MATILCAKSGLEVSVQYFPIHLTSKECQHPIFDTPQKRLLSYAGKWATQELTPTDSYLLFLALLDSTNQVEWRVAARKNDSIVQNNMEDLIQIVGKINIIRHPAFILPSFVISPETSSLETVHYWITAWEECLEDFRNGYKKSRLHDDISIREHSLEKLIRNAQKDVAHYASSLAEWAALAGEFPSFQVYTVYGSLTCDEYWKLIIRKCSRSESIFSIPAQDLAELIEHCEDNIQHGSIFAYSLMELLRKGQQRQKNFLGLGDLDSTGTSYKIISEESTVEDANKLALIQTAPHTEPKPEEYPSRLAYLKAKFKYQLAQKYLAQQPASISVNGIGEI